MGKTRPDKKSKKRRERSILNGVAPPKSSTAKSKPSETPESLLRQATALLETSRADEALQLAQRARARLQPSSTPTQSALPALNLIAEILVELGDADGAREHFLLAAELDPEGTIPEDAGGGVEKFLWLAQLSEQGGAESVEWFQRGAEVLRRDIGRSGGDTGPLAESILAAKQRRLATTLCGVAEVYMTDLSWEEDAERRCEALVTEAVALAPDSAEALQTLASVRISQLRVDEARAVLSESLELWMELPGDDPLMPDFPTRVSLARLLLETEMEEKALDVLERLLQEDDQSVEVWYLGGWGHYLIGNKMRERARSEEVPATDDVFWDASRDWLQNALRLFEALAYEDDRLREHAVELLGELDGVLGESKGDDGSDSREGSEAEDWEDEDQDEDEDEDDIHDDDDHNKANDGQMEVS
ncbi:MAG: NAD-dependent histone deacetylase sir2 [Sclerophora amabilis]|nr:MAG: NAD-dependent histone deacetylase sir2 [Sclerophora amabilis]